MKKKGKNNVIKIVASSIAIFAFGLFIGYEINFGSIASIQGYLFNSAGEATDSNASDANASDSNASDANATCANSSDPTRFDDVLYITSFDITATSAKINQRVPIKLVTYGADSVGASVIFENVNSGDEFSAKVKNLNTSNPYIVIPNTATVGKYRIKSVMATARNSDGTTFTKTFPASSIIPESAANSGEITILQDDGSSKNGNDVTLSSLTIAQTNVNSNEKVYVSYKVDKELQSLKLLFVSDNSSMSVFVKDLNGKAYFEIPSTVKAGIYTLKSATLVTKNSTTVYTTDGSNDSKVYAFNSVIAIKDSENNTYVLNNKEITSDIIKELYSADTDVQISVDADTASLIDSELFAVIKGTNRKLIINYHNNQIVFNGKDINNVKSIDTSMTVDTMSKEDAMSKLVSDGIVVGFADNGELPGKALVRVKETSDTDNTLDDKVNIYYYDEEINKFNEIALNVKKTSDGYYEFVITHNSDYLITNKKIDSKLIAVRSNGKVVSFQKSNKIYLLLIALAVVVIIGVVVIIVVNKRKQKKTNGENKEDNNNVVNSEITNNTINIEENNNNTPDVVPNETQDIVQNNDVISGEEPNNDNKDNFL